jgi:hypothetical protein
MPYSITENDSARSKLCTLGSIFLNTIRVLLSLFFPIDLDADEYVSDSVDLDI